MSAPTVIADGFAFLECPRWHDGTLWVNDMHDDRVVQLDESGKRLAEIRIPGNPGGSGWLPDGSFVVASTLERRIYRVVDGTPQVWADLTSIGATEHEINDMVVGRDGRCFIGEFGFDVHSWLAEIEAKTAAGNPPAPEDLEVPAASVFSIDIDGTVAEAATDIMFPNGGSLHPVSGEYLVGETFGARYSVFTTDGPRLSNRTIVDLGFGPDGNSRFDAEKAIWFSDPAGRAVHRVLPGGTITDTIEFDLGAFACDLGGRDGRTLFVCGAPTSDPHRTVKERASVLYAVRVEVPVAPEYGG